MSGTYTYITVHWFELIGQVKNHLDSGPTHVRCNPLTRKRKETSSRPSPPSFIIPMKSSWRLSQPLINNHGGTFALFFPTFLNYSCGYHLRLNSSCIRRHGQRKQFCWLKLRYPFQFCEKSNTPRWHPWVPDFANFDLLLSYVFTHNILAKYSLDHDWNVLNIERRVHNIESNYI